MIVNLAAIALGLFIGWTAAHISKEFKNNSSHLAAYRAGLLQNHNDRLRAKAMHPSSSSEPTDSNVYKLRRK